MQDWCSDRCSSLHCDIGHRCAHLHYEVLRSSCFANKHKTTCFADVGLILVPRLSLIVNLIELLMADIHSENSYVQFLA